MWSPLRGFARSVDRYYALLAAADEPRRGDVIEGVGQRAAISDDCFVFHAGTALTGNTLTTHGGRVLCVTGLGDSVRVAQARAHAVIDGIRFDGMQLRHDIGYRAIAARRETRG